MTTEDAQTVMKALHLCTMDSGSRESVPYDPDGDGAVALWVAALAFVDPKPDVASTRHVTIPSGKDDALPNEETAMGLLVGVEIRRTANLRRAGPPQSPGRKAPSRP